MPNMSYCMFRNTLGDLGDCLDKLCESFDEGEDPFKSLSREEAAAAWAMYEICKQMITVFEEYNEEDI